MPLFWSPKHCIPLTVLSLMGDRRLPPLPGASDGMPSRVAPRSASIPVPGSPRARPPLPPTPLERAASAQSSSPSQTSGDHPRQAFRRSKQTLSFNRRSSESGVGKSEQETLRLEEARLLSSREEKEGESVGSGDLADRREKEFHEIFLDVPRSETVVRNFECSLGGRVTSSGRIFVTPVGIYFYAKTLGRLEKEKIPFADVMSIEKHNSAVVIRDSIEIITRTGKYMFQSFVRRDEAWSTLTDQWNAVATSSGERRKSETRTVPSPAPNRSGSIGSSHTAGGARTGSIGGAGRGMIAPAGMGPGSDSRGGQRKRASAPEINRFDRLALFAGEAVCGRFENVIWLTMYGGQVAGVVVCTNHSFIFVPEDLSSNPDVKAEFRGEPFRVTLPDIFRVKKESGSSTLRVADLWTKTFRRMRVGFTPGTKQRQAFVELIAAGMTFSAGTCFAKIHRRALSHAPIHGSKPSEARRIPEGAWGARYSARQEFERIAGQYASDVGKQWRETGANEEYRLCETYPTVLVVPAGIADGQLRNISAFRSKGRIPVLSWLDVRTGAALCRCAQPSWGLRQQSRCRDDEDFVDAVQKANGSTLPVRIYDARPFANAVANATKGKGYETAEFYPNAEIEFCGIGNIHVMRKAQEAFFEGMTSAEGVDHIHSRAEGWLAHIQLLLQNVAAIVSDITEKHQSVIVHCSDGWDRTAQLTSLACLALDPFYRTFEGFVRLIEKEYLSFGFKGHQRLGWTAKKEDERSPIFLQFVECVYHIVHQFPASFEFSERFLVYLLDDVYSGRYGSFLMNCERERVAEKIAETTLSVFDSLASVRANCTNVLFDPSARSGPLRVCYSPLRLHIWEAYYLRSHPPSCILSARKAPDTRTEAFIRMASRKPMVRKK